MLSFTFRSCQRLYVLLGRISRISGFSESISIIWENICAEMPHRNMKRLSNGPVYLKGRLFLWSNALLKVNVSGSTTTETVLIVTCAGVSGTFTITHTVDFHGIQPIRLSSFTATAFWEHASPPPPSINRCLQGFRNPNKQLTREKPDRVVKLYGSRGHEVNETEWKRTSGGFTRVPPPLCMLFTLSVTDCVPTYLVSGLKGIVQPKICWKCAHPQMIQD